jgi:hypothetical protein
VRVDGRRVATILVVLAVIIGTYWTLWYGDRSLVASESASYYQTFESAFPLADGLLAAAMLLAARGLWRGRSSAILWGLMAAGGGVYLFAMDVLFDIEHGIWTKGSGGVIELCINVITLLASTVLAHWLWAHRVDYCHPPSVDARKFGVND